VHAKPKPYKGAPMEGLVARWYARNTARSLPAFAADARRVAALLPPHARILEVAPGPGYFVLELARLGPYRITGLDISRTFVEIAARHAAQAGISAEFCQGSASAMPFPAGQFDFLFRRAAFKNFSQPVEALREMHRVLKPGGRAWIVDLRRDAPLHAVNQEVAGMRLGAVNAWFTRLAFRYSLLKRAYTKPEFERLAAQTPFRSAAIAEDGIGMNIWLQK